ncbi:MAG: hypothetical protein ACWGSQ_11430 [Longimicrobiales bacterium]
MRRSIWLPCAMALSSLLAAPPASGQGGLPPGSPQEEPLRVFLDCQRCDMDHFRREVAFISYVRDRMDAQLHVLVTSQRTGAGGNEYTFNFIGLQEFSERDDTLRFSSRPDDTDDETREDLIRTFKLGLVPFLAETEIGRGLDVSYRGPRGEASVQQVADPWNLWVFNIRAGGELDGESTENSNSFDGSLSASRTTEELKMDFRASGDWSRRTIDFGEEEGKSTYTTREYEVEGLSVWSLSPHWSAGATASASGSTRQNQDLTLRAGPAVEYNYFPYSESTRRAITFLYKVEVVSFDYEEITLYQKTSETRFTHSLAIASAFNQPWGELDITLEGSNYLDRIAQHRIEFFSRFEIRLFRGLSLDIMGSAARVKDQIYAPLEDIPIDDILLRRRELGTDYEYSLELGFNFTFGSVFNNVVNPRMSSGGGRRGGWH